MDWTDKYVHAFKIMIKEKRLIRAHLNAVFPKFDHELEDDISIQCYDETRYH